ncbi:MAG: hypothetical protein A3G25_10255 [Betaproteobacteria bacterium RIFCSPLOWO2_12_FULL_63_13]|nr:MAG: hypothetical protein A3G25_10255 [Betaproteobacteria bacterium RIFCSPLOWO2_12_FULL_63_13]
MDILPLIRRIPDYPSRGAVYYDLTTLLMDGAGFHALIDEFAARYRRLDIRKFVCMEWRGFVIGAALAYRLGAGFVPVRSLGALPGGTVSRAQNVGPVSERLQMSADAIAKGDRVVFVDDLLATGALSEAALMLVKDTGAEVVECCYVQEIVELGGRKRLEKRGLSVFSFFEYL